MRAIIILLALVATSATAAPKAHPSWEIRPQFAARVTAMKHDGQFVRKCLRIAMTEAEIEFCWSYQE